MIEINHIFNLVNDAHLHSLLLGENNIITRACFEREAIQLVYGTVEYVFRIRGKQTS